MKNETVTIIILIFIIIVLLGAIFAGGNQSQAALESLRTERNELVRSTAIIESVLESSRGEVAQLKTDYIELEQIIDNLTAGSQKTESELNEYGSINSDFAEFLRSAVITD